MIETNNHPEFDIETERLKKIVNYLWCRVYGTSTAPPIYGHKIELLARHEGLKEGLKLLVHALPTPYFGRFDFQEEGNDQVEEFYISKFEGLGLQHGPVSIIYWASPIGSLYYQTTRAKVTYVAPQGGINGDVYLRRQLLIHSGYLERIIDEFDRRRLSSSDQAEEEETFFVNPDEYLRLVLEGKRDKGLTEVVTSIQERQNEIMRADPEQIMIVQGPAGSGKTTIALHRVAVLLYVPENQKHQTRQRLMIIGANRLFLSFISKVLPSINIENVPQLTFVDWAARRTGISNFNDFQDTTLKDVLYGLKKDQRSRAYERSRFKGSLDFIPWLEKLAEHYRMRSKPNGLSIYPVGIGSLGVFYTITEREIATIIQSAQDKPINRQRDIVVAKISQHLFDEHEKNYRAWTHRIAELLNSPPPELDSAFLHRWEDQLSVYGFRRIEGTVAIPDFRYEDQVRSAETRRERALRSIKEEIANLVGSEFERFDVLEVYVDFLSRSDFIARVFRLPQNNSIQAKIVEAEAAIQHFEKNNSAEQIESDILNDLQSLVDNIRELLDLKPSPKERQKASVGFDSLWKINEVLSEIALILRTRDLLVDKNASKSNLRFEDIAPLTFLYTLFEGDSNTSERFDHIIVDEAQDMSPLEMWLLRSVVSSESMTILGDVAQSIHSYRGINHWREFNDVFDVDRLHYEEIDTTYRSTYEIMTYANLVLQTPVLRQLNYQLAEPFARHGPDVRTYEVSDIDEILLRILDEIEEIKAKGLSTVAIIGKDVEEGTIINDFLHNHGYQVDYIIDSDSVYGSEIAIIPSFLAKGLEFDACIIADASDEKYPSDPLHGRLLYVAITRALHELVVMWRDVPSPHLPE